MRLLTLPITEALSGRTVGNLLKRELKLSGSLISHLKYRPDGIMLNGSQARTTQKVTAGDILAANISDDLPVGEQTDRALAEHILFEDEDILIFSKPAGMEMHPQEELPNNRSVKSLACGYLGGGPPDQPVARLDAGTSGIMPAAKNRHICDRLRRLLHTEGFIREYLAITCGIPAEKSGSLSAPIDGADAQTDYTVLASSETHALLRLRLHTGRTHQIRIHMSGIGCPLLGDDRYGERSALIGRPALHSAAIRLQHPLTNEQLTLFCPPPQDFTEAAERLFGSSSLLTEALGNIML